MLKKITDSLSSLLTVMKSFFSSCSPGSACDFITNVGDTNYFDFDSDVLTSEAKASLEKQAEWLNKYKIQAVTIEGHADAMEGMREYCLALGERRASSAKNYLSKFYSGGIHQYSYGKERPCSPTINDRKNRRVVTIIQ
jgi:peptidoglycan-associated lipoprotein